MKWVLRTLAVFTVLSGLIVFTGWAFAGLPAEPKDLPTGAEVAVASGRNYLLDPNFSQGGQATKGWVQKFSTAGQPIYEHPEDVQEIAYTGEPQDANAHHEIEMHQTLRNGARPGQRWQFSIFMKGPISKGYVIVGVEWFHVDRRTTNKAVGNAYTYIAEQDVYPHTDNTWRQVTVTSPELPQGADGLSVYVQFPEINAMTRLDVKLTDASLVLKTPSAG